MSIDEVMTGIVEYGIEQRRATINESTALRASIRAAIEQHVAREREACALICDAEGREWDSDAVVTLKNYAEHCAAAIRARAEKETT